MNRDPADVTEGGKSRRLKLALLAFVLILPFGCVLKGFQVHQEMNRPFDAKRWKEVRRSYETTRQNGAEFRLLAEKAVHQEVLIGKSYEEAVNLLDLQPNTLNKKEILEKGYTVTLPDDGLLFPLTWGMWLSMQFDERGKVRAVSIASD